MASASKRARSTFTTEEVTKICARSNNDPANDIDSITGGLSSEEEFQLDHELELYKRFRARD